ncbi:MAG: hypothetical protein H6834_15505 [Planctomycetes bacterium]|nr:hypothetical protein [Planctomycetota bacterium]
MITVVIALLLYEVVATLVSPYFNDDRAHMHAFEALASELSESTGRKVLVLGNSLTHWGVDRDLLATELEDETEHADVHVAKFSPVGTDIVDWIYILRTFFIDPGRTPDVVVIGFVAHHVPDNPLKRRRRLGRYFVAGSNLGELFQKDIHTFEDRCEVLGSRVSYAYGDQPQMKYSILSSFIPNYYDETSRIESWMEERGARHAETSRGDSARRTYTRLERLVQLLADAGIHGIFVPMPLPEVWDLDEDVRRTVEAAGMTFLDARALEGLGEQCFWDGYHMNEEGAAIYTRRLAQELDRVLAARNPRGAAEK